MIIRMEGGDQVRGDLIKSARLRSDMAPIPLTFEADIRSDESIRRELEEGKVLEVGRDADKVKIIKSQRVGGREAQGEHDTSAIRITAVLDNCHQAAFVRRQAIIKENATLLEIYRAAGARVNGIENDFQIPRFTCTVGDTPTFHIARALQEEGGGLRWKNKKLQFFRLPDLFAQKAVINVPDNASDDIDSGFLERHLVPFFFSLDESGAPLFGNNSKPRRVEFSPFKNELRLRNMTRCLVLAKKSKLGFTPQISAGDLINVATESPLVVITAAHVYEANIDGDGSNQYTRLWLGRMEE